MRERERERDRDRDRDRDRERQRERERQTIIRNEEKIKTKKVQLKKVEGGKGRETHSIVEI